MINSEETKRNKARQLRYKKPIAKYVNLAFIKEDLWNIQEACEEVHWYTDSDDGVDSLINALDGDDDEANQYRMSFADLCAECERMAEELREEWIPDCFDLFFVATSNNSDEMLGWDSYEGDYMSIGYSDRYLREDAGKKLKQMTKDNLIEASVQCMTVYKSYIGLRSRYDSLKAAIDILKDQNTGHLQTVNEIEKLYTMATESGRSWDDWSKESREWKRYTNALPQEAWIA